MCHLPDALLQHERISSRRTSENAENSSTAPSMTSRRLAASVSQLLMWASQAAW